MGIKSKKSKLFETRKKILAGAMVFLSVLAIYVSSVIFVNARYSWDPGVLDGMDFYDTYNFRTSFGDLVYNTIDVHIYYQDEKAIEAGKVTAKEEILRGFKNYYGIVDGVITNSTEINSTFDGLIVNRPIPQDMEEKFLEYKNLVEKRLPQYRKIYIQNLLEDYRSKKRTLENNPNFLYYIEDEDGVKVAGNIDKNIILAMDKRLIIEGEFASNQISDYYAYTSNNRALLQSKDKLYASIRDPLMPGDSIYESYENYKLAKNIVPILLITVGVSSLIFIGCLIYLIYSAGQKESHGDVTLQSIDRIYNDIHLFLFLLAAVVSFVLSVWLVNAAYNSDSDLWSYIIVTLLGILLMIDTGVFLSYIMSLSRQIKKKLLFRNTLIAQVIRKIGSLFSGKVFRGWIIFLMIGYAGINALLIVLVLESMYYGDAFFVLMLGAMLVFNMICIFLLYRAMESLTKIMVSARETSLGNLRYALDISKISPSFINFATDISNIQNGLKKAVEEAVKGERMKAELITNVSHDLKTPLTSMITYVDLLKKENLNNAKAEGYVEILNEKSYRLKQLIEDLIEASKASSGNLAVTQERVNLNLLMMQAMGELEEKIQAAGLQFKMQGEENVVVWADGRHTWRIAENIISNTIKYSMPNSRVYVEILRSDDKGMLVLKNISNTPIELSTEQLTERFVRGDESRTTEGAGLGLSITKSLAELQGGRFQIQIDGDLFKAIVELPLCTEEIKDEILEKEIEYPQALPETEIDVEQ